MSTTIIAGNATNNGASISSDTAGSLQIQTGSTPTTAITVDSSQNVGIGNTSPVNSSNYKTLTLNGTNGGQIAFQAGGTTTSYLYNTSTVPFIFYTNSAEAMRIDSSGNLLVGTTVKNSGNGMGWSQTDQYAFFSRTPTTASYQITFWNGNGLVGRIETNGTATSYVTSSDYRLKENIAPMQNALNVIQQLNPVTYTWKIDGSKGQGFIAHELQSVVPDCVSGEKDAINEDGSIKPQGIDTSFLVATLTAAIQEQQAMIEELKTKVLALEAK